MNSDLPLELGPELLDDFYAECDEQLTMIRQGLAALDDYVGKAQLDGPAVEKLFRNFHSLKGNAAIVGLRPAEELAHSVEGFLRDLSQGHVTLTLESIDLIVNATQRLEQMVALHRDKKPAPDASPLCQEIRRFSATIPQVPPAAATAPAPPAPARPDFFVQIEEARARGLNIWQFIFTPHRDLDQRGINVTSIRQRIGAMGDIIRAIPQVHPGGSIAFEFIAAMADVPQALAAWEADGIRIQPYDPAVLLPHQVSPSAQNPESAPETQTSAGPFVAPSHVVRVDLSRLDDLIRITGDMVIHRARLDDQVNRLSQGGAPADPRSLQEVSAALARDLRQLREGIMRIRLVPVAEIFARMPFVVRDLARDTGKQVRLTLSGQHTEIDKYLVERLKDPLLHLVRNSVSHGIESPAERTALGKPAQATIFLRASTIGDSVLIEMGDDGRGIDVEAVGRRAVERGLQVPANLNPNALLNLISLAGFSTRDEADRAAGRGVGMSVVNAVVRELGGTLSLETEKNKGVQFKLRLPLTLAIADVFIVSAHEQICAVPQSFVQEVLQLDEQAVRRINGTEVIPYRGGILPLVHLRSMFGVERSRKSSQPVLVLSSERGSTGLVVDRIHGQREVVVRAMRDPLIQVPGVAGATELGDGRPILILDVAALTGGIVRPHESDESANGRPASLAIAI